MGYSGAVLRTVDGGQIWTSVPSGTSSDLYGLHFRASDRGWACGRDGTILFWDGVSWSPQSSGTTEYLLDVYFVDDNTGWMQILVFVVMAVVWVVGGILKARANRVGKQEEEEQEVVDRSYWEKRGSSLTVEMADSILELVRDLDPSFELKYNKFYIGLARAGEPFNFVIFRPQKQALRMELKLSRSDEIDSGLESRGLDLIGYDTRNGLYKIRLTKIDIDPNKDYISELLRASYGEFGG